MNDRRLSKIHGPEDLKGLSLPELYEVAREAREAMVFRLSHIGGHGAPNLGVVELTVALHYVFSSPKDKIVFDVSHQSYAHKILTGRAEAFEDEAHFDDVTGFTNPAESEHDLFEIGHTSTSISLALGLAKARDLMGGKENVIALIGDGSLSGGEALEGLNVAGEYGHNLLIIVNDNGMSIAENHGGLYQNLRALRESHGACPNNLFRAMGLDYRYLEEGHDLAKLIAFFQEAKGIDHPLVLHIHTIKGKGLPYAEKQPELYHSGGPFRVEDGAFLKAKQGVPYFKAALLEFLDQDPQAFLVNAATPGSIGFPAELRETYASRGQYLDVGIAEQTGVSLAGGAAKRGAHAVFVTFASFFQRTYDQLSQDVALNDLPATFLVRAPGAFGLNGSRTHSDLNDIAFFASIPHLAYLDPSGVEEWKAMFLWATSSSMGPTAIRTIDGLPSRPLRDFDPMKMEKIHEGSGAALLATGPMLPLAEDVVAEAKARFGLSLSLYHPRCLSCFDEEGLKEIEANHSLLITLEDGMKAHGFGEGVASYFGASSLRVKVLGLPKEFAGPFDSGTLLEESGVSLEAVLSLLEEWEKRQN